MAINHTRVDAMQTEVKRLEQQVREARELVRGSTFDESPHAFKNLESLKVRLTVAKNPNHYAEKYAALFANRARRMN